MTQEQKSGQVIWCLGMYASASTWAFNVVRQVVEVSAPERFRAVFASGSEKIIDWGGPDKVTTVKSHEISSEARVLEISRRASKILLTLRDPRDAVVSLMQAHGFAFSRALELVEKSALLCRSFSKDRRAMTLNYETGFFDDEATITVIARHLGYDLEKHTARAIHDSLQRGEVENYIGKLPKLAGVLKDRISGDLLDPKTQWHSHHSGRNGEIGKWRKVLTASQIDEISSRMSDHFVALNLPA